MNVLTTFSRVWNCPKPLNPRKCMVDVAITTNLSNQWKQNKLNPSVNAYIWTYINHILVFLCIRIAHKIFWINSNNYKICLISQKHSIYKVFTFNKKWYGSLIIVVLIIFEWEILSAHWNAIYFHGIVCIFRYYSDCACIRMKSIF